MVFGSPMSSERGGYAEADSPDLRVRRPPRLRRRHPWAHLSVWEAAQRELFTPHGVSAGGSVKAASRPRAREKIPAHWAKVC